MSPPVATYRVQLRPGFGFREATAIVSYLAELGISTLYSSPILRARAGSTHGYDVTDPTRLNPELGTEEAFGALSGALRSRGMGLLLDIVPNHMAASHENPWWWDVLREGRSSRYAGFFDIHWEAGGGRVILPVLGGTLAEVLGRGELKIEDRDGEPALRYFERWFPLTAARAPAAGAELRGLLGAQHYELCHWKEGARRINYRRFFDIADLVSLRAEDPEVFDATHATILRLATEGHLAGVRVDHVDGLRDPASYLKRLRRSLERVWPGREPPWIVVEKILARGESIPDDWPVDGTTGYEFATAGAQVLVDPRGFGILQEHARSRLGLRPFDEVARESKREALELLFAPDLDLLTSLMERAAQDAGAAHPRDGLRRGIVALTTSMDVYRTYLDGGVSADDTAAIDRALDRAARGAGPAPALALIRGILTDPSPGHAALEFTARWQQLSGPAMAKGFEDTALYRYPVLLALNEVGGRPELSGGARGEFHDLNGRAAASHPLSLLATSTHDTKRSEDARARLTALSEFAEEWTTLVDRWSARHTALRSALTAGRAPGPLHEHTLYQAMLSVWPLSGEPDAVLARRVTDHFLKAMRESKLRTSWLEPESDYEGAGVRFVEALFGPAGAAFRSEMDALCARVSLVGAVNSLTQLILKVASPGVPDFYQGSELWDLSLVDPDNRRPVDFARRSALLGSLREPPPISELLQSWPDGRLKMCTTERALRWRRRHSALLASAGYTPLFAEGPLAEHVVAFARTPADAHPLIAAVPRLVSGLMPEGRWPGPECWRGTELVIPGAPDHAYTNALDGSTLRLTGGRLPLERLFASFPGALLALASPPASP